VRYVWAAYKEGALDSVLPAGLAVEDFKVAFHDFIVSRFDAAWALYAETKRGFIPVGLALGFWPHPQATPFLILDSFVWFPWSTPRNRIESAVNFLDQVRLTVPMMGFERHGQKGFCEVIAKHGLLKRVGTSMNVFGDEPASVWETRT
jgi:hypothetical protein